MTTGPEHLQWAIDRPWSTPEAGDMDNAWASFISDCGKRPATAWIPTSDRFLFIAWQRLRFGDMAPAAFRRFLMDWDVLVAARDNSD